jgi:hypothetical protein
MWLAREFPCSIRSSEPSASPARSGAGSQGAAGAPSAAVPEEIEALLLARRRALAWAAPGRTSQPVVERHAADPQRVRRLGTVVPAGAEHLHDDPALAGIHPLSLSVSEPRASPGAACATLDGSGMGSRAPSFESATRPPCPARPLPPGTDRCPSHPARCRWARSPRTVPSGRTRPRFSGPRAFQRIPGRKALMRPSAWTLAAAGE